MTIKEFADKHNVEVTLYKIPFRTDSGTEWDNSAKHYAFTLVNHSNAGKRYNGNYSQGSGIKNRPTVEDILNSLILDTMDVDFTSFNSFCDEFGYDSDSRKAYKIYEDCLKESEGLKHLFTSDQLKELYICETL